jgi:DNA (cytosine-5)-methyltransferase 1
VSTRTLSLFSGVGGLDLGLQRAGWEHVGFCEWIPYARDVLRERFPGVRVTDDVTTLDPLEFAPVDLVCFGSPCQDVSTAGTRRGLAGERSGLFFEAVRVVEALRPRAILMENVPGLFSSQGGRDFGTVLAELAEVGYGLGWRVLDSRFFGVPQRRRRVFIVGARADGDPRAAAGRAGEVLSVGSSCPRHPPTGQASDEDYPGAAEVGSGGDGAGRLGGGGDRLDGEGGGVGVDLPIAQDSLLGDGNALSLGGPGDPAFALCALGPGAVASLRAGWAEGGPDVDDAQAGRLVVQGFDSYNQAVTGDVAHTLSVLGEPPVAFLGEREVDVSPPLDCASDPARNQPSATVLEGNVVRKLTPLECERLQGFPEGWTDLGGTSDGKRYHALGNAVTVPVAEWIGRRMIQFL